MLSALLFLFFIIMGYLAGSVCSAIIVSRLFSLPDPRSEGSRNPGATNVLRLAGKKYAAIVLLGDILKGLIPVALGQLFGAGPSTLGFICLAVVLGHIYPVFFGFKGGKGVATALGALLGLHFIMGVIIIAIWLLVANFSRYSSLASITAMVLAPFFAVVSIGNYNCFPPLLLMTLLILYHHRTNMSRLLNGEEPKIKFKHHQLADVAEALMKEKGPSTLNENPIEPMDTREAPAPKPKAEPVRKRKAAVKK